jgi:hypothetical protein
MNPNFPKRQNPAISLAIAALLLSGLSACGGGGSPSQSANNSPAGATPATPAPASPAPASPAPVVNNLVISGTVATGAAMANATVQAKCAVGLGSANSTGDGSYSIKIADGVLPCVLNALSADKVTSLNSAIEDTGVRSVTANISTLTHLVFERINAQANGKLNENFPADKDKVIGPLLSDAKQRTREALASIINLGSLDPIKDVLVAQSPSTVGNAHDAQLDQLRDRLSSANLTLPGLTEIISDNLGGSVQEVLKSVVQAPNPNCAGFRSGSYRLVEPANSAKPTYLASFDARTLTATIDGKQVSFTAEGCRLNAADGTIIMMGYQGLGVMRTAAGTLAAVMPSQTLSLGELQGNWNFVSRAYDAGTAIYKGQWGEMTLDSAGKVTARQDCNTLNCTALPSNQLASFSANAEGGFSNNQNEKFFAYRSPKGVVAIVGFASDGVDKGKLVFARKGPDTLPPLAERFYRRADINVSSSNFVATSFDQTEYYITSVEPGANGYSSYTRRSFVGCFKDTFFNKIPFGQMFSRSGASTNTCTGATNTANPIRGVTSGGLGVSAYVTDSHLMGFTVIDPQDELDTNQNNFEKAFTTGRGMNEIRYALPVGAPAGTLSTSSHYFLTRSASAFASPKTGPQSLSYSFANASNTLTMMPFDPKPFTVLLLKGGALYRNDGTNAQASARYVGNNVYMDWLGTKLNIPAGNTAPASTVMWSEQIFVMPERKLEGLISRTPTGLANEALYTGLLTTASLVKANYPSTSWISGAAFYRTASEFSSDRIVISDCVEGSASLTLADASNPIACSIGGVVSNTIEQVIAATTSIGGQTPSARTGTIGPDREGARMWVAQSADSTQSTTSYRVYFQLAGKVYVGSLNKAGSPRFSTNSTGQTSDMLLRYNDAAIRSLNSVISF